MCLCNATQKPFATNWTSPLSLTNACHANSSCKNSSLTLNPYTCLCSIPLTLTLQLQSATFTKINYDTLWDSFKNQTYASLPTLTIQNSPPLKLQSSQIWVRDASFIASLLLFFPPSANESALDHDVATVIETMFNLKKIKYPSPFGVGLVIEIIFSIILGVLSSKLRSCWRKLSAKKKGKLC